MANFPRRLGCGSSGKTACCGICCIVDFVQIVSQYISEYTKKQSADISHDHWFNFWEKASYCRWMRRHIVVPENVQREAKLNSFGVEKMCEFWPSLTYHCECNCLPSAHSIDLSLGHVEHHNFIQNQKNQLSPSSHPSILIHFSTLPISGCNPLSEFILFRKHRFSCPL